MAAAAGDAARSRRERETATFVPYYWEAYNEIVEPRRFDHYLVRRWLSELGPTGFAIVKALRDRCYHNPQTGILRDSCEVDMDELATSIGISRRTLFREFSGNDALGQFVRRIEQYQMVAGRPQQRPNLYQVSMDDPVHPSDMERYDELRAIKERQRDMPPPKKIVHGKADKPHGKPVAKAAPTFECQNGTQSGSYECHFGTPDECQNDTPSYECQNGTPLVPLPFGNLLTKESLTPAAAPQHKCCPPEGEAEGEGTDPLTALWQQALSYLSEIVNIPTFEAHLKPLRPVHLDDDTFLLAAPSAFTLEWILKRHEGHIEEALEKVVGRAVTVQIMLESK